MRIKKEKKAKLVSKLCCLCGIDTCDYIIFENGAICKDCQDSDKFKKLKDNITNDK